MRSARVGRTEGVCHVGGVELGWMRKGWKKGETREKRRYEKKSTKKEGRKERKKNHAFLPQKHRRDQLEGRKWVDQGFATARFVQCLPTMHPMERHRWPWSLIPRVFFWHPVPRGRSALATVDSAHPRCCAPTQNDTFSMRQTSSPSSQPIAETLAAI